MTRTMTALRHHLFSVLAVLFGLGLALECVAADPANPPPCKDPWVCYEKPSISGTASGSSILCADEDGTWKVEEKSNPGKKTRCSEEKEVGVSPIAWGWEVKGPENASGYGNSFTKSFSTAGSYTVVFTGYATSQDSVCEHPDKAKAEYSFTVRAKEKDFLLTGASGGIEVIPSNVCPGKYADVKFSVLDYSACWDSPYVVKWKIETNGGDPVAAFVPSSGSVTIESQFQEKEVACKIFVSADSPRGTGKILVTATRDEETETIDGTFEVPEPDAEIVFGAPADLQGRPLGTRAFGPGAVFLLPYTTTNSGKCTEVFDDVISSSNQAVKITSGQTLTMTLASGRSRLYHARIQIAKDAKKGAAEIKGIVSAYGQELDSDTAKIEIIKCEASDVTRTEEIKFDLAESKIAPLVKTVERFTAFLDRLPLAKVTPNKPKVSGSYKQVWGEECCPDLADPTPYSEHSGSFALGLGATASWNPAFQPIFAFKLPGGQRQITGQAFIGLISSISLSAGIDGSLSGRSSVCTECVKVTGKISLSAAGTLKVGAEGKVFYTDYDGKEFTLAAELTGAGEIKGDAGTIEGTILFGKDCKPAPPLRGCFGPVTASAEVRIKFGFVSAKLPKWSYPVVDKICFPE